METWQQELARKQLERVLLTPDFATKERLSALLRFIVANSLEEQVSRLKETVIGVEVYRRDATYNPKENAIVRTEVRRLRNCLEHYYADAGRADTVRFSIPKGSYVAQFEFAGASPPDAPESTVRKFRLRPARPGTRFKFVAMMLGACLIATATYKLVSTHSAATVWAATPFTRLPGVESFPAFSPDGRQVVFAWAADGGDPNLYVQDVNGDLPQRITSGPGEENRPAWSPDGKSIAFLRLRKSGRKELLLVDWKTAKETKVAELEGMNPWLCIVPRLSWSTDGRYIFTSESFGPGEACGVVAIDLRTRALRRVSQPPAGAIGDLEPAVSPNGRKVAFLRNAGQMGGDIYVKNVEGGTEQRVTFDNRDIMGFTWSADGRALVVASRRGDGVLRLWQMDATQRAARQLTDGAVSLGFPSSSPLGNRIAFTSYHNITSIWQAGENGRKELINAEAGNSNPQLSPDGKRLVFRSDRTGAFELWTSDGDGHNARRLTRFNGPMVSNPAWSPDGQWIAFEGRPRGHSEVCLISTGGSDKLHRLTRWDDNESLPSWSRDGRFLYFSSNRSGRWEIYRQRADASGEPVQVTQRGGMRAQESWDGRWLYVHRPPPVSGIARIPVSALGSSDEEDQVEVLPGQLGGGAWGSWDIGPQGLVLVKRDADGHGAIEAFETAAQPCRRLLTLPDRIPEGDRTFSVAPDGKTFLYVAQKSHEAHIGMLIAQR